MSFKKFDRNIPIIALCCICLFILGFTDKEADFKSAMDSYNNKDFPKAFQAFQSLASEQGNAEAQFVLGMMCEKGEGVPKNVNQAVHWYTKAAEQGHLFAQCFLAQKYADGEEIPQDYKQALHWYTKVAEQDDVNEIQRYLTDGVEFTLGGMYYMGKGTPRNYTQAVYWFTKAVEKGEANAEFMLAMMYDRGEGVHRNYKQALHWYTKAAEHGVSDAQRFLGEMYYLGKKVPQNYTFSYMWFNLAASQGDEKAIQLRDSVVSLLSPQQTAQAQSLAAEIQYKINHPDSSDKSSNQPSTPPNAAATHEPKIKSSGTGFLITGDGYLLTCLHVIQGAEKVEVAVGDDIHPAKIIRADENNDLALLKISGIFNALSFSPKRTAAMGENVFTIGYPNPGLQGINPKLTNGTINSLTGFKDDLRFYQISVPVQPGNSVGPLLDDSGNVYGVIVAMLDAETAFKTSGSLPQNVNYAVKSTYAQALLDTMPEVAGKLLPPGAKVSFNDAVKRVEKSIVMVLTYK